MIFEVAIVSSNLLTLKITTNIEILCKDSIKEPHLWSSNSFGLSVLQSLQCWGKVLVLDGHTGLAQVLLLQSATAQNTEWFLLRSLLNKIFIFLFREKVQSHLLTRWASVSYRLLFLPRPPGLWDPPTQTPEKNEKIKITSTSLLCRMCFWDLEITCSFITVKKIFNPEPKKSLKIRCCFYLIYRLYIYIYLYIYLHSVMDSLATLANGADMFLEHCHNEQ